MRKLPEAPKTSPSPSAHPQGHVLQGALMRPPVVRSSVLVKAVSVTELASEPKVDQKDVVAAGVHQDVGGLDVVVAIGVGVDVLKRVQHLQWGSKMILS